MMSLRNPLHRNFMAPALTARVLGGTLKIGLLVVGLLLVAMAPSSSRAGEFIKLGSPIGSPVNLYGITSIYNSDLKAYEAWAVGELLDPTTGELTHEGVILHYTGSYWTRIAFDTPIPVLRAVSGIRFMRWQNEDGSWAWGQWSTAAWAVGDGGAIYHLSPYTGAWRAEKRLFYAGNAPQGRSCLDAELIDGHTDCRWWSANALNGWTGNDLKTVNAVTFSNVHLGGANGTMMYYGEYFAFNAAGTGYIRDSYWNSENTWLASTVTMNAISYIDNDHGWMAGYDTAGSGSGKIWKWTNSTGFVQVTPSVTAPSLPTTGIQFTSVAAVLRSTASTANQPLKSVAWLGATNGKVYRYDEATNSLTIQYNGTLGNPSINSISVTRRQAGVSQNLIENGNFSADRQDGGFPARAPDGWTLGGQYTNVRDQSISMVPSALIPITGGNIYVGAPWQTASSLGYVSGTSRYVYHLGGQVGGMNSGDTWSGVYPYSGSGFWEVSGSGGFPTFTLQLPESDVSIALLKSWDTKYPSSSAVGYSYGSGPVQLGTNLRGYIKVNSLNQPYQFRVVSPNGKAELYIEQDLNQSQATLCYGGLNDGNPCNYAHGDGDCSGGVCRGTKYPNNLNTGSLSTNPPLTAAYSPGECKNEPQRHCSGGSNAGGVCTVPNTSVCVGGPNAGTPCVNYVICKPGTCVVQENSQCLKSLTGTCLLGHCSAYPDILCSNKHDDSICQDAHAGDTCVTPTCTDNSACTISDPDWDRDSCINPTPTCQESHPTGCFDDSECLLGSCEVDATGPNGSLSFARCKVDNDCGNKIGSISYKCQPWGLCDTGTRSGLSCIKYGSNDPGVTRDPNADCTGGGTCVVQTTGYCQQSPATTKPQTQNAFIDATGATSAETPAVSFTGTGIKSKECADGSAVGRSCNSDAQCLGGSVGSCKIVPSNWYPFVLEYYQANAAQCVGGISAGRSCLLNSACPGGTCTNMQWCVGGINSGKLCDTNADGTTNTTGIRSQACANNGVSNGKCVLQYATMLPYSADHNPNNAPGQCISETTSYQRSCWSDNDCYRTGVGGYNNGKCSIQSKYDLTSGSGAGLKFQWKTPLNSNWSDMPSGNIMMSNKLYNTSSLTQEVPLSNVPGTTYLVTGKYKVDFPNYFQACPSPTGGPCYQTDDPRLKSTPHAGVKTTCKNNGYCGYDTNTLLSDPSHGVIGEGHCSDAPATSCTTNTCATGYCSVTTSMDGGWQKFSLTLTKQQRDSNNTRVADDGSQTLVVGCYADVGAEVFCKDLSVTIVSSAAEANLDTVDLLAVGSNGTMVRATDDFTLSSLPVSESWVAQNSPSGTAKLNSVTASDPFHYWIAGNKPTVVGNAELITLLTLNPGNVSGWAWMGSATRSDSNDPIGWIDFNCGNLGTCLSQPSSFGVNVGDPGVSGVCSNNPATECTTATTNLKCGGGNACLGAITGSAWLGNRDPNEQVDYGPCKNIILTSSCSTDSSGSFNYCPGNTARICSDTSAASCAGLCAKNQGFKCTADSQCIVSCSQNPTACSTAGWLSFDRKMTGNPPAEPYQSYAPTAPLAAFDATTDRISGWGRLQLGVCENDESKSCFKAADCGIGNICSYKNAASWASCIATSDETSCNASVGWVKFSGSTTTFSSSDAFMQCRDCSNSGASGNGTPDSTCKICSRYSDSHVPTTQNSSCNSCSECALKRCTTDSKMYCSTDSQCPSHGKCMAFGYNKSCAGIGWGCEDYCFDMDTNPDCLPGAQCMKCDVCSDYGVSIDYVDTKDFNGFAYSPDVGWIDFSEVRVGGKQFLQTKFGDIYSGGDIGGSTTSKAPGFPGGTGNANNLCNATYRLVAAGTITNFCTSAPTTGEATDPFKQEHASLYPMPSPENSYTTQIGAIDIDGIGMVVKTVGGNNYNKNGDVVREYDGNANLSDFFGASSCGKPCIAYLGGRVYHVMGSDAYGDEPGDLTIDKDFLFMPDKNGAGTVVVDGDLIINGNIEYSVSNSIASVKMLPSIGFLVKGNIVVQPTVAHLSGTFFTSQNISVPSSPPDLQLTVSGTMVASKFNFLRIYNGSAGVSEPAELVIYDGRLQANTPPGFSNFANGIMSIQDFGQ